MNKKSMLFFITFFIAAFIYAVVRYYQCAYAIDYATGFFNAGATVLGSVIYWIMVAVLLFFGISTILLQKNKGYYFKKRMGQIDSTECGILGALLLAGGIGYLLSYLNDFNLDAAAIESRNQFVDITENSHVSAFFQNINSLLIFLGFLLIGINLLIKKRITIRTGMFMILPTTGYILKAMEIFSHNLVVTSISDMLIPMIIYLSVALFYLALGRVFIRDENKTTKMKVNILGFFIISILAGENLGKFLYWITLSNNIRENISRGEIMINMPTFNFVMDGVLVFVILFLLHKEPFRTKNEK